MNWGRITIYKMKFLSSLHHIKYSSAPLCNLFSLFGVCILIPKYVFIPCQYSLGSFCHTFKIVMSVHLFPQAWSLRVILQNQSLCSVDPVLSSPLQLRCHRLHTSSEHLMAGRVHIYSYQSPWLQNNFTLSSTLTMSDFSKIQILTYFSSNS